MPNAKFYVANFTIISLILVMLGTMGMANDIYGDKFVVVDSSQENVTGQDYDFDVDRIRFNPKVDNPSESQPLTTDALENQTSTLELISPTRISYDGGTINDQSSWSEFNVDKGDFGYDYAAAQYDVSNRTDNLLVSTNPNNTDYVYVTAFYDGEAVVSDELPEGTDNIDLSGDNYGVPNIEALEFIMVDSSSTIDLGGELGGGGLVGAANTFVQFLNTSFSYISEVPKMISGYIGFALALPGTIGTFLRLYIGGFALTFVVLELWIG